GAPEGSSLDGGGHLRLRAARALRVSQSGRLTGCWSRVVGATAQPRSRTTPGVDLVVLATVGALGLISLVLVFVAGGSVGVSVAPLALFLAGLAIFRMPLRYSLIVLGFLCLTLENPGEMFASNKWSMPLATLGALLLGHLNVTIPIKALFFSGADLLLLLLA